MSSVAGARESIPERTYRSTVEGRRLEYQLTVIQQPERARACGSGAKSSADRRPVDPPPVVELRIFEYNGTEKKDITFSYSANFFLYATLEHARPIAHGRMPGTQQPPVLTGMPVSGMAYLDRPQEAGYFIFPDLSVRHEGKYRLSFNLYEETKDPKDHDAEPVPNDKGLAGLASPNGSFDWRLEVKSVPFDVFSAKKFPGLAESTVLSRTVAEQGCRVRIRRDVRMRRRDGNKDHENYEDDEYNRLRRSASPADSVHEGYTRHRSLSQEPKRPAIEQHQQYPQGYGPSQAPPPMPAPQFAPPSHYPIQHATYPPAPMPPQQPRYAQPPPPPAAPASQPYYQADYNRGAQAPSDPYGRDMARAQYEAQMREKEMQDKGAYEDYQRRSSVNYGAPAPAPQYPSYSRNTSISYPPPPQQQYPPRTQTPVSQPPVNLAPLKMPAIEPKYESLSSPAGPLSGGSRSIPPQLPSPATYQDRPGYSNYSGSAPTSAVPDATRNGKRPYDAVFSGSASSYSQPLRNGMRPTSLDMTAANFDDDDDAVDMEALKMQYKRADGNIFSRELPTLQ